MENSKDRIASIVNAISQLSQEKKKDFIKFLLNTEHKADIAKNAVKKDYNQLLLDRREKNLIPGQWYRITDYVATTSYTESRSAGHQFDILVLALTNEDLCEECYACKHEGDTYFENSNLNAWKVWYTIDNDSDRFVWADEENGKGVIYRFENDVPYDFKSIQFKRYKVTAKEENEDSLSACNDLYIGLQNGNKGFNIDFSDYKWYYTFSKFGDSLNNEVTDASLSRLYSNHNKIVSYQENNKVYLNNIVFANGDAVKNKILSIFPNFSRRYFDVVAEYNIIEQGINSIFFGCCLDNRFGNFGTYRCIFVCKTLGNILEELEDCSVVAGEFGANKSTSLFKQNIVFGEEICDNTFSEQFSINKIVTGKMRENVFGRFDENIIKCSQYFHDNNFDGQVYNNTFTGNFVQYVTAFGTLNHCNISKICSQVEFRGQFQNIDINENIVFCFLSGIASKFVIPEGSTNHYFSNIEIKGTISGDSQNTLSLDYEEFYTANPGVKKRTITIETDANQQIVASWWNNGVRKVITKAIADENWTEL